MNARKGKYEFLLTFPEKTTSERRAVKLVSVARGMKYSNVHIPCLVNVVSYQCGGIYATTLILYSWQ